MIFIIISFNVLFARKINDVGQLLSREQLPIGNKLTIQYSDSSVECTELGFFVLKQELFMINILQQFEQTFYPSNGQRTFIIDNNKTIVITISGYVNQPANLFLNISQPLWLKSKNYSINGQFLIQERIMKLLVYESTIIISANKYKDYVQIIDLYGAYEFDLGNIAMILAETKSAITLEYSSSAECYLMCTKFGNTVYVLQNRTHNNVLQFNGQLLDEWPQLCLLYAHNGESRIIQLTQAVSDLTGRPS